MNKWYELQLIMKTSGMSYSWSWTSGLSYS